MSYIRPAPSRPAGRRRRGAVLAALTAGGLLPAAAVGAPAHAADAPIGAGTARAIPGQYIVVLKDGADAAAVPRGHGIRPKFVHSATIDGFAGPCPRFNSRGSASTRRSPMSLRAASRRSPASRGRRRTARRLR